MLVNVSFEVSGENEAALEAKAKEMLTYLVSDPDRWVMSISAHHHPSHEHGQMMGKVMVRRKRSDHWDEM